MRFVLVAKRQVQQQIEFIGYAQSDKFFSHRFADEAIGDPGLGRVGIALQSCNTITASISTNAPRGSAATPTAARAGYGELK